MPWRRPPAGRSLLPDSRPSAAEAGAGVGMAALKRRHPRSALRGIWTGRGPSRGDGAAPPRALPAGVAARPRDAGEPAPAAGPATRFGCARPRGFAKELSTSASALRYEPKPDSPKSVSPRHLFDTHAVVRLLEENGFSTQQAEVVVQVLVRMTNSNMDAIYHDMVTKVQQEIMLQRVMSQIASVKKDMIILEKSEFSTLLAENEKVKIQLFQLKVQLADIMNKVRSDTIMDMNLEKSSVKEMKADHEKRLLETRTEIMEMHAEQDRHLTQANMKIDTEVAGLKTMLESHKLDTIKYLAGSVFTCLTVVLGFYRIWM